MALGFTLVGSLLFYLTIWYWCRKHAHDGGTNEDVQPLHLPPPPVVAAVESEVDRTYTIDDNDADTLDNETFLDEHQHSQTIELAPLETDFEL